jgi:hypothetical protein
MNEALKLVECSYDTPRAPLSNDFWVYPSEEKGSTCGVYNDLKNYQPATQSPQRGGLSDSTLAIAKLEQYKGALTHDFLLFANEVIEDIQQYGSLPRRTIKKIAEASSAHAINDILVDIARVRGFDYVYKLRDRSLQEEIVVTVQRN